MSDINTDKVTRIEIIDTRKPHEEGGGRVYTFWEIDDVKVEAVLQDAERTLKLFIRNDD